MQVHRKHVLNRRFIIFICSKIIKPKDLKCIVGCIVVPSVHRYSRSSMLWKYDPASLDNLPSNCWSMEQHAHHFISNSERKQLYTWRPVFLSRANGLHTIPILHPMLQQSHKENLIPHTPSSFSIFQSSVLMQWPMWRQKCYLYWTAT